MLFVDVLCSTGLETNARPRRVKLRPGEWFVRPDQPGGGVDFFFFFLGITIMIILKEMTSSSNFMT